MRRIYVYIFVCFTIVSTAALSQKKENNGQIILTFFTSKFVDSRTVGVWLPADYSDSVKYDVLYVHDGQMLFDSSSTWNKQAWEMDEVMDNLLAKQLVRPTIVVGIWNNGKKRHAEYFPEKVYNQFGEEAKKRISQELINRGKIDTIFQPVSDRYLAFITQELKPYIDSQFSVNTGKEHTFIMGSSMGGLISLYAMCEYPDVFGGAACLSTHWTGTYSSENNPIPDQIASYLKAKIPLLEHHFLYFDCGDQTLDALYPSIQKQIDALFQTQPNIHFKSAFFPGENHSEKAWNKRIHIPLTFLLEKKQ